MLPAVGAASLALDAIQSLTSPASSSSSKAAGAFGPALSDPDDGLPASPANSMTVGGFGSTQISSGNLNALLDAQSLASGDLASTLGSGNAGLDPTQGSSASASSAYSAINQLTQSTAMPLGLSPFSVSV